MAMSVKETYYISPRSVHFRKGLEWLEKAFDKVNLEIEEILCNDQEIEIQDDNNKVAVEPNVTIKPPIAKKGQKEKRNKSVLERRTKKS